MKLWAMGYSNILYTNNIFNILVLISSINTDDEWEKPGVDNLCNFWENAKKQA